MSNEECKKGCECFNGFDCESSPLKGCIKRQEEDEMKEICKNCEHCKPTYKGGTCEITRKKVNMSKGTCEEWKPKK